MNIQVTNKIRKICLILVGGAVLNISQSCKKLIEVDLPSDRLTGEQVFSSKNNSVAAINSVYYNLQNLLPYFNGDLGLASDDLTYYTVFGTNPIYINDYTDGSGSAAWKLLYVDDIYPVNAMIEGLENTKGIGEGPKKILIAEAKFIRAFSYFYLVNLFGDCPLVLTTDINTNMNIPRTSKDLIYEQIIKDLNEAKTDLPLNFLDKDLVSTTPERVRPTKFAAAALLARIYLYQEKWSLAETLSTEVILNNSLFNLSDVKDVFLKNSEETIWALQPNFADREGNVNTSEAKMYIPFFTGKAVYTLSPYTLSAFGQNDNRKVEWLFEQNLPGGPFYYPFKYKIGDKSVSGITESKEYSVVFRLAEQYLIRAEARAQLGKLSGVGGAIGDLNKIRFRAGLDETPATTKDETLNAISRERQAELFSEWGHRWLDLKRTGKVDAVMRDVTPVKGGTWAPYKALFPIPYSEFPNNPALRGHQNPGYSETP